ncbi:MAG: hypothetical protein QGH93_03305 [Gammaproteobacteria bacterium]|jgi:hypothetical protein|nr:hypothetical protein [Chromatiales bacterium]MDP6673865.1 hypothetical protein [Gammaproteobacteria bacterium]
MVNSPDFLPGSRSQPADRRDDYDVTNTVNVASVPAVRDAVQALFEMMFPTASFDPLWLAFHDFNLLFDGRLPGYRGCDTVYHDKQHTLDMTLAMTRLMAGYESTCAEKDRLGPERTMLGIITALFHDSGYIRRTDELRWQNGAEVTSWHVSRGAEFLRTILPRLGLEHWSEVATRIVHFTGYEIDIDDIELDDPNDIMVGHFLGTADLMAQMADRCYLEKCRDRLYSEFVLAGVTIKKDSIYINDMNYSSGIDLLKKTPDFFQNMAMKRLNTKFNRAYQYIEVLYDGRNPYFEFIEKNLHYLCRIIDSGDWHELRRSPPCYTALDNPIQSVSALVSQRLSDQHVPDNSK